MPRRRFSEALINRDPLGRFAKKAGGRAPAIPKREGKNAARREASSRLLRATRARRAHAEFHEKNQFRADRKKQVDNAKAGVGREQKKIDDARAVIRRERERSGHNEERQSGVSRGVSSAKKTGKGKRPQGKRAKLTKDIETARHLYNTSTTEEGRKAALKKAADIKSRRDVRQPLRSKAAGRTQSRSARAKQEVNQKTSHARGNELPPARMSPGQERKWNVRLQHEVRTAGGDASRTSPVTEPDDYLYVGGERVDLHIGDYIVEFDKFPSNPDKLAKKFDDIGYDIKRDDRGRRWVLKRKPRKAAEAERGNRPSTPTGSHTLDAVIVSRMTVTELKKEIKDLEESPPFFGRNAQLEAAKEELKRRQRRR